MKKRKIIRRIKQLVQLVGEMNEDIGTQAQEIEDLRQSVKLMSKEAHEFGAKLAQAEEKLSSVDGILGDISTRLYSVEKEKSLDKWIAEVKKMSIDLQHK